MMMVVMMVMMSHCHIFVSLTLLIVRDCIVGIDTQIEGKLDWFLYTLFSNVGVNFNWSYHPLGHNHGHFGGAYSSDGEASVRHFGAVIVMGFFAEHSPNHQADRQKIIRRALQCYECA
ncbi:uncharacterized protein CYBJADRAFT_93982 [Cyberlindnera jadinii NRRL Y-1542]|uniref:Secreted protein n=1 Tax=Cyberlindnera jadinii (strain ATCC 18201 / CBS 1600 / BCRC 20928 / JCM 3617 / NBRC 0987 / NRRL Y-1542) TaxID=983966 RepID=A0A1E4S0B0_CYBJN|nr:hypothetical protein CYBJADRAFT_93982 [Cyberlindnera jadinii NRRL Y-1542]ODV72933.1 hypothetical protein CYBJADRAFT_93982 [Cyberlindnera jadinii NRRL Y-1542]